MAIRDEQQPLLVSRSKPREIRAGMPETVFLIPELCRMTGLTDAQRANFQLMRALAEHTRVAPPLRIDKLIQFRNRLEREPGSMEVMKRWNLTLDQRLVQFNGRSLPPEQILAGSERKFSAGKDYLYASTASLAGPWLCLLFSSSSYQVLFLPNSALPGLPGLSLLHPSIAPLVFPFIFMQHQQSGYSVTGHPHVP